MARVELRPPLIALTWPRCGPCNYPSRRCALGSHEDLPQRDPTGLDEVRTDETPERILGFLPTYVPGIKFEPVPTSWDVMWDAEGDDAKARKRAAAQAKPKAKPPKLTEAERRARRLRQAFGQ